MNGRLRVGRIPYLNLLPVFLALEETADPEKFEYIEGVPSALNRKLRDGDLDISPSSSIEYLRDRDSYLYLKDHSISSRGPVRSVLLFSRIPIEDICSQNIMATDQSETSIALLRVILNKFYGHDCSLRITCAPFHDALSQHSAYLSIGDDALTAFHEARKLHIEKPDNCHAVCSISNQVFYVYDLGELWALHTGLPSVYALWTYKRDLPDVTMARLMNFEAALGMAMDHWKSRPDRYAGAEGVKIPPNEAVDYWSGITYGLPDDCVKGLELFGKYLKELGILG